jgi:hypothetical protein
MEKIIEVNNAFHLGDNIINFIFFHKIKDYIESNNIIIHYYCHKKYHPNVFDFKCSDNIKLFDYEEKGYHLWQGTVNNFKCAEDRLIIMFNAFLTHYNIPITVDVFEYEDMNLFERLPYLDKYKDVNVIVVNSHPMSGQFNYDKNSWDEFIVKLSKKYIVATTEKVDGILSLHDVSVKNIASIALHAKIIIAINTGPSIPLYNTHILNNIEAFYIFDDCGNSFNTRKTKVMQNINDLSFLL